MTESCEAVKDRLAEYHAGALEGAAREAVEQHVADCAACRAELRALEATAALLDETPLLVPTRDLWPGVEEKLTPRARPAWWRALLPSARTWPAYAAAALLLVMLVGAAALQPGEAPVPVSLARATDLEAGLFAGWHARASFTSGVADPYALAVAATAHDARYEAAGEP